MNPVLVEAMRGGAVESAHRGAVAVLDADGAVVVAIGDIDRPIFPRSAVKVLQALPLVESGAADQLGLDDEELAVACASHNGEPAHTTVVARMLGKAGLDAAALECGTHWPRREPIQRQMAAAGIAPSALHNNCSGKHAGFLCVACRIAAGAEPRAFAKGYVGADHPVMREGERGAAMRHRIRPGARRARHRRLLDPDLKRHRGRRPARRRAAACRAESLRR